MKCPKCGQEIIDIKEFCVSCGTRLKTTKEISRKTIFIIMGILIIIGVITCYIVINYNTENEIKPYINQK